jgi:hypothetical protein
VLLLRKSNAHGVIYETIDWRGKKQKFPRNDVREVETKRAGEAKKLSSYHMKQPKVFDKAKFITGSVFNLNNISGPPVEVGVTMYVLSISSVSEVLMVHQK